MGSFLLQRDRRYYGLIFLGTFLLSVVFACKLYRHGAVASFDDSYMFLRYSKNLLAGHGIAWNPDGVQTYGVTAFLYFLAVTAAYAVIPLSDEALLFTLSLCFGLGALLVMAATAARFTSSSRCIGAYMDLVFLTIMSFTPHFSFHCSTGMDTTLALLLNAALIFLTLNAAQRKTRAALILLIAAGYLTFLTRPDSMLYAALFPPLFLLAAGRRTALVRTSAYLAGLGAPCCSTPSSNTGSSAIPSRCPSMPSSAAISRSTSASIIGIRCVCSKSSCSSCCPS